MGHHRVDGIIQFPNSGKGQFDDQAVPAIEMAMERGPAYSSILRDIREERAGVLAEDAESGIENLINS